MRIDTFASWAVQRVFYVINFGRRPLREANRLQVNSLRILISSRYFILDGFKKLKDNNNYDYDYDYIKHIFFFFVEGYIYIYIYIYIDRKLYIYIYENDHCILSKTTIKLPSTV